MVYVFSTSNRRFGLVAVHAWYWRFASHGLRVRLAPLDNCVAASIPILVSAPPLATKHHYLHFEAVSSSIDSNPDQDMNSFTIPQPKNSKSVSNHHHFRKCADSFVPHIFVWGSCFWFCIPPSVRLLPSSLVLTQLVHTQLTHTQLAHTQLVHTQIAHTQLVHTQLAHTQLVITQLAHTQLAHTQLAHTQLSQLVHTQLTHTQLAHTQLVHTQLAHTQLVHTRLAHTQLVITQLAHTQLAHTQLVHTQLAHTQLVLTQLVIKQLALTQLAHTELVHTQLAHTQLTLTLRGRRGTYGTGPALVAHRVPKWRCGRRGSCVAGVALGDIDCHFAWQAWRLRHWAGSGGAPGSPMTPWTPALCVAGVALGDIDRHFAWRAWHLRHWAGSGGAPGSQVSSPCVALGDMDLHFAWQAWHLRLFAWQAWHLVTSTVTLRGRRGTWRHVSSLGDIDAHFAWQAWHLRHWAGSGGAPGSQMTPWTPRLFAWQAWHLVTSTVTLRGRRGAWWHRLSLCMEGVALGDMYLHLVTSTLTLRGRRGTYGTGPALVAHRVQMMQRTERRTDCSRFWLFLCVCSNAATSIAISMAHQVQMLSLHFDELSKTQRKCHLLRTWCNERSFGQTAHVFGYFSVCVQMLQHPLPFPWLIRCKCFCFILTAGPGLLADL